MHSGNLKFAQLPHASLLKQLFAHHLLLEVAHFLLVQSHLQFVTLLILHQVVVVQPILFDLASHLLDFILELLIVPQFSRLQPILKSHLFLLLIVFYISLLHTYLLVCVELFAQLICVRLQLGLPQMLLIRLLYIQVVFAPILRCLRAKLREVFGLLHSLAHSVFDVN